MAKTVSKQTDPASASQPNFEAALERLEKIVEQLDDGNLPLAQSLALFKEGTKLSKVCRDLLAQAELAVKDALRDAQGDENEVRGEKDNLQFQDSEEEDGA